MKIILAPDSFKGSLSSLQAAAAMKIGIKRVLPKAVCVAIPMADGGEGTVQALVYGAGGRFVHKTVTGPLGEKVRARYGLIDEGQLAVIEMAAAAGLTLVPEKLRNPLKTTTIGVGELLIDALERGVQRVLIGIGGSATNDGGVGMAQALGARFYDQRGRICSTGRPLIGGDLHRLARVDISGLNPRLAKTSITIASDVNNPLCGARGATRVYGRQKGATDAMIESLDADMRAYGKMLERDLGRKLMHLPGAGGAGGLGAGLFAFANARIQNGAEAILEAIDLKAYLKDADLVMTGEGMVDSQTAFGKAPAGVAQAAHRFGVPTIAIGGGLSDDARKIFKHGIDGLESGVTRCMPLEEAMKNSKANLANAAERAMRLILIGHGMKQGMTAQKRRGNE
ncbi:MAG: glycerate kinase [Candidatus Eutrophobiaceae bacterium]